jgi:hypothetical protein
MRRQYKQLKSEQAQFRYFSPVLTILVLCGIAALSVLANSPAKEPASANSGSCRLGMNGSFGVNVRSQIPDELLERSTPQFAFNETACCPALVFCTVQTHDSQHHPGILIHDRSGWHCLEMASEVYDRSVWVYAGATQDRKLIWAVSDSDVEGPGWDLELTFSSDAGRTWRHVGSVQKPSYLALLDSLQMETRERGWLSVYLDDEYYPGARRGQRLAKGYYVYYTHDGWRHWSSPRYSRRKPRVLRRVLRAPSYTAASEYSIGIDEFRALMARMEATPKR